MERSRDSMDGVVCYVKGEKSRRNVFERRIAEQASAGQSLREGERGREVLEANLCLNCWALLEKGTSSLSGTSLFRGGLM